MAKILMIIAPEKFRDEELFEPKEELEKAGHQTVIASVKKGTCSGARGGSATAEVSITDVDTSDYDAVVFVGGGGSDVYFENETAHQIACQMADQGKVVSAICIAPVTLANAGLLKGKQATVFETEIDTIKGKGAIYAGPGVAVDGRIVTGDGPKNARRFGQEIANLLQA
ncbi:MAG: DJ-1/PfpI family protein [Anaerolineae bacterium]|nr:DJ-1/PfpI family protein [Anaerolineae bacterium]